MARLFASIVVLARGAGLKQTVADRAITACLAACRSRMAGYSTAKQLDIWYDRVTVACTSRSAGPAGTPTPAGGGGILGTYLSALLVDAASRRWPFALGAPSPSTLAAHCTLTRLADRNCRTLSRAGVSSAVRSGPP